MKVKGSKQLGSTLKIGREEIREAFAKSRCIIYKKYPNVSYNLLGPVQVKVNGEWKEHMSYSASATSPRYARDVEDFGGFEVILRSRKLATGV